MTRDFAGVLASEMEGELREDILVFWQRYIDPANGGFYGQVENDGRFDPRADKGLVMQARFLWTYAAAARLLQDPRLLLAAGAAYRFIVGHLLDAEHRGFHWACDSRGAPRTGRKVIYGQAFAIYALAEYARAGGPRESLDLATETFHLVEGAARDRRHGGYFEAVASDWSEPVSSALGAEDLACPKSMNTNLHMLEALSSLHAASADGKTAAALGNLIDVHLDRILAPGGHLGLYFGEDWSRMDRAVSYGHDIEASWLLAEAAECLDDEPRKTRVREAVTGMAEESARVLDAAGGSLPNELKDGKLDTDRIWWVQAEGIVGMVNAAEITRDPAYLRRAWVLWEYVKGHLIDRAHGEWFWGARHPDGDPLPDRYKGGFWKASYHDGRACMEVMKRLGSRRDKGGRRS
jgi:cellobiose epimerase